LCSVLLKLGISDLKGNTPTTKDLSSTLWAGLHTLKAQNIFVPRKENVTIACMLWWNSVRKCHVCVALSVQITLYTFRSK